MNTCPELELQRVLLLMRWCFIVFCSG